MPSTAAFFITALMMAVAPSGFAAEPAPLTIEAKIPLGAVRGRIDHLAVDLARKRLFVAELGNHSVAVVDLDRRLVVRMITGLDEPQGVGYVASIDTLYVANAGDGSVRLFAGADLSPAGRIDLDSNADNVRVDNDANRVIVGHGSGGLAIIDAASRTKIGDIALRAHPEGFQFDTQSKRAFINLPDARAIGVADLAAGKIVATIPLDAAWANFPMALDRPRDVGLVVTRSPPKLWTFGLSDSALRRSVDTCGDADDVFVDTKRDRVYVSCGAGFVDVFVPADARYRKVGHMLTAPGARTSLFVPELDRLFLAVRAEGNEAAAIWVLRPLP